MDGLDLNNIGFKYVDIPDPTSGEGGGGTATGAIFFDKTTGKEIPDYLGNNQFLVIDRATQKPKIQQGWQNEGLSGIYHGFKDIATNPGVQYIAKAALLGNAAAGLGAGAGAGAGGYGVGAETAMNDLLMQEAASGGLGSLAAGTSAEAAMNDLLMQEASSGGLGSLATVPTAESAMADVLAQEAAAGAGTTSAEAAMADLMSTEGAAAGAGAVPTAESAMADLMTTEGAAGAGTAATAGGLSKLPINTLAKLAMIGAGAGGIKSLTDQKSGTITTGGEATGPLAGYTFDPSAFRASTPDPMWFRPGSEIETVSSQAKRGYAQGGSTKPTLTPKAKLASMDPWSRALAEMNNAAYGARMPRAMAMPQAGIAQLGQFAQGGQTGYNLGSYSDGGRLLRGPGDGVSDSIPATIGQGQQPARLADGEFVIPARIVSELGNGSTDAGARKLYAMMDRVQRARGKTTGKGKVAANTNADKHLPA